MKAIFTGRDWSEGYRTGHEYILDFNQKTGGNIWIYPLKDKTQSPGKLPIIVSILQEKPLIGIGLK